MSAKRKPLHCAHVAAYWVNMSDSMTDCGIGNGLYGRYGIHDVVGWLETASMFAKKAVSEWKRAGGVVA